MMELLSEEDAKSILEAQLEHKSILTSSTQTWIADGDLFRIKLHFGQNTTKTVFLCRKKVKLFSCLDRGYHNLTLQLGWT